MPETSSADAARDAATQLTTVLLHLHPVIPSPPIAEEQLLALGHLAENFSLATELPDASTATTPPTETITPPRMLNANKTQKTLATKDNEVIAPLRVQIQSNDALGTHPVHIIPSQPAVPPRVHNPIL